VRGRAPKAAAADCRPCVLKIGGEVLDNPRLMRALIGSVKRTRARLPLVLVHGGGGQVTRMAERLGLRITFKNGRRVTDAPMAEVVEMVLCGLVNKTLAGALVQAGVPAIGVSGKDLGLVEAEPVPGLGHVGVPRRIRSDRLLELLALGYTPVLASVAAASDGSTLNINADDLAASVAASLGARNLLIVSARGGVRRDPDNRRSGLLLRLSTLEAEARIALGVLTRGMIPKIRAARRALEQGVGRVGIVAPVSAAALSAALERGRGRGTWIVHESPARGTRAEA
jgi:acetylglutamate kinase